jgi:hypothetical protein
MKKSSISKLPYFKLMIEAYNLPPVGYIAIGMIATPIIMFGLLQLLKLSIVTINL